MIETLDRIKDKLSFKVISLEVKNYKVYLTVGKNNEMLTFVFFNSNCFDKVFSAVDKQIKFGAFNKKTDKNILETMTERKANWLLTDNNFNFIQCMNDQNLEKVKRESVKSFLLNKERWAVAEKLNDKLVRFINSEDIADYEERQSEVFSQKVYLNDETFVYVQKGSAKELHESETLFLFKKFNNELHIHTILNKGWIY